MMRVLPLEEVQYSRYLLRQSLDTLPFGVEVHFVNELRSRIEGRRSSDIGDGRRDKDATEERRDMQVGGSSRNGIRWYNSGEKEGRQLLVSKVRSYSFWLFRSCRR